MSTRYLSTVLFHLPFFTLYYAISKQGKKEEKMLKWNKVEKKARTKKLNISFLLSTFLQMKLNSSIPFDMQLCNFWFNLRNNMACLVQ